MVFRLSEQFVFPDPSLADEDGLVAVGGDLHPNRLLEAYRQGIFPWFSKGYPIMWWSPDPRLILYPSAFTISHSLHQTLKKKKYSVTINHWFSGVIEACADAERKEQDGTWITEGMKKAYNQLHRMGFAHSVETWIGPDLVGGLYGISIGKVFCGESMFHCSSDASKVALAFLVEKLREKQFHFIDCQVKTNHLMSLGAVEVSRSAYLSLLKQALENSR
ncbi:MAG: leucyl/phenylalanyl-tRNA--protein transferase [Bacteroidetes bacterium]|nr:leucyl/phenylalanyl-tRNA--protein transferase [Bacteroidota bacterium]